MEADALLEKAMRGDLASCLIPVCLCATVALAADPQPPAPAAPVPPPDRQAVIRYAAESGEGTWKKDRKSVV